jgi:hypothetical protein
MKITLDRVALEDVGAEPQRLAEAILGQMCYRTGVVPIEAIAYALDITEIREEPLTNFEGTLVTTAERDCGAILVNRKSAPRRRRFTVAHELGHYLNPYHVDSQGGQLSCGLNDMRFAAVSTADRHRRHEAEANRFAIEILAPRMRCRTFLSSDPDIAQILAIAQEFNISREAAARRYVELHDDAVAVVFTKGERVVYCVRSNVCPALSAHKDEQVFLPREPASARALTDMAYIDASFWVPRLKGELMIQTLFQEKGHALSLLRPIVDAEEEPEIDDTYDRFARLSDRQ